MLILSYMFVNVKAMFLQIKATSCVLHLIFLICFMQGFPFLIQTPFWIHGFLLILLNTTKYDTKDPILKIYALFCKKDNYRCCAT